MENLDRLVKRYKKKCEKVRLSQTVYKRLSYRKPSEVRRQEVFRAMRRERFKRQCEL